MDRQSLSLTGPATTRSLILIFSYRYLSTRWPLHAHCGSVDGARLRAVVGSQGTWRIRCGSFCADIISRGIANVIPRAVLMLQSFAKSFHLLLSFPEVSDGGNGWRLRWAFVYMYRALGVRPLAGKSTKTLAAIRVSFL